MPANIIERCIADVLQINSISHIHQEPLFNICFYAYNKYNNYLLSIYVYYPDFHINFFSTYNVEITSIHIITNDIYTKQQEKQILYLYTKIYKYIIGL